MRKKKLTISATDQAHLRKLDPDGWAYKAYAQFAELSAKHAALLDQFDDKKFGGVIVPDKHRGEYDELCQIVERVRRQMFTAFDNAMHAEAKTFHVPQEDAVQVIYDALMSNATAMPDEYAQLSGLERGREFKRIAGDLVALLKTDKTQVTEEVMDVPFCDSCLTELSS